MPKKKPFVVTQSGFRAEWFTRRSSLDVDVYAIEPDGSRGSLIAELSYPNIPGIGVTDFMSEVVAIAKQRTAQPADA